MLTPAQVRRDLEHHAHLQGLSGVLVTQVVEDICRIYMDAAQKTVAALDATSGYEQAEVDRLREEFIGSVAQLQVRYNEQSNAVLAALLQRIRSLPPPQPSLADRLEALDRAILGPPDSGLYRFVDSITLGLFRKK